MLEPFRQYRIDTVGNLRDQFCLGGTCLCGAQRVPHLNYAQVDAPHQVDEQAQQPCDCCVDDETCRNRPLPGSSLVG